MSLQQIMVETTRPVPLHISIQIQFQWNGVHAIQLYNGYSGRQYDNATFFIA